MIYWLFFPAMAIVGLFGAVYFGGSAWAFVAGLNVGVMFCSSIDEYFESRKRGRKCAPAKTTAPNADARSA